MHLQTARACRGAGDDLTVELPQGVTLGRERLAWPRKFEGHVTAAPPKIEGSLRRVERAPSGLCAPHLSSLVCKRNIKGEERYQLTVFVIRIWKLLV